MEVANAKQAPVFSTKVLQGTGVVGGAYSQWAEHYNQCTTCQHDHWYNPTDVARFCDEGRYLFNVWDRVASRNSSAHQIVSKVV